MSTNTRRNSDSNQSRKLNNNIFNTKYGNAIIYAIKQYLNTHEQTDEVNNVWTSTFYNFKTAFQTNTEQSTTINGNQVTVGFNENGTAYINRLNERTASNMKTHRLSNAGLGDETHTNSPPRRQSGQRVLQLNGPIAGETGTDPTPMLQVTRKLLTPSQLRAKPAPHPPRKLRPAPASPMTRKAPNRPLPVRPVTSASEYVYYNPTVIFMPGHGNNTKRKCLNRQNQTRKPNNCIAYLKNYDDWQQNDYKYRDIYKAYNQIRSELDPNPDYNRTQVLPTLPMEMVNDAERKIRAEIKRPDSIIGYFLRKKASQEKYRKVIKDFVTKLYNFYKTCTDNQCSIDTVLMYGITLYTFAKQNRQIKITQYNTLNDYLREKHAFCKKHKATCKSEN
jgi:hypothetical protein